jgi:hypothetical protein
MTAIDPNQPEGKHIYLRCVHHPHLRWHTKNIDFIGARGLTYASRDVEPECDCEISDLEVVPFGLCEGCGEETELIDDGLCVGCLHGS